MKRLQRQLAEQLNGQPIGHYFACWCPFDSHRKPALMLYPDYFICLSCGEKGPLSKLREQLKISLPRIKASSTKVVLPKWRKWVDKYDDLDGISWAAHRNLLSGGGTYFRKRKVEQFIEQGRFGILNGWATFPVFNQDGDVIDIVVRTIRDRGEDVKYVICPYTQEAVRPLYVPNWERLLSSDTVYVPFGMFDAWAFEAIGLASATGITGKTISIKALEVLKNKHKIIVPDYNEWKAAYKLAIELGSMVDVLRLPYDQKHKDPDDFRTTLTELQFKRLIEGEWTYAS